MARSLRPGQNMRMVLDAVLDDVQAATRSVWRSPGFAVAVVATIAVGVGGNLATLSIVDRLLFRPPPGINDASNLRRVYSSEPLHGGVQRRIPSFTLAVADAFTEAARGAASFEGYVDRSNLALGDSALRVKAEYVSHGYLAMLGLRPRAGRFFTAEETTNGSPVAVLSEALWKRRFGGTSDVIGRTIRLAGAPVTIVGVLDGPFQGIDLELIDAWMPLLYLSTPSSVGRDARAMQLLVRLAHDSREAELAGRLSAVYRRAPKADQGDPNAVIELAPLAAARNRALYHPMATRNVDLTNRLAGVALVVLVVAIGNVVVLFLLRAVRRRRELAVRSALGASRLRIAGQLVLEGLILGCVAALFAVVAGTWSGGLLGSWLLPPTVAGPMVDGHSIVIASFAAVAIGCLASLTPAVLGPSPDGGQALRLDAGSTDKRGSQLRKGLLTTQVALCIALITVAVTFQQSLIQLAHTNLGVDRERLITISLAAAPHTDQAVRETLTRIAAVPGVVAVANAHSDLPPGSSVGRVTLSSGRLLPAELTPSYNYVDTGYFRAAGVALLRGRSFDATDGPRSPRVAVITQSMATAFWPGRSAIGDCFYALGDMSRCVRIVGVVSDVRWDLSTPPQPRYFMPIAQFSEPGRSFVVRTRGRVSPTIAAEVERVAVAALGRSIARPIVARVADRLDRQIRPWKAAATLFTLFGVLALVSAAVGIYGTVSYEIAQRRTELGIRLVLGARLRHLLQVVGSSIVAACTIGAVVGLGLAFATSRVIASYLFDTPPANLTALGIGFATVTAAALAAGLVPAMRAAGINLTSTLRG